MQDINRIHKMDAADFNSSFYKRPGIRAQLMDMSSRQLVTDFLLMRHSAHGEGAASRANVLHALNIASPGWTCAFPFADRIVSELMDLNENDLKPIR